MSDFQVDLSKSDQRFLEQEQDLIDHHRMEKESLYQESQVDFIFPRTIVSVGAQFCTYVQVISSTCTCAKNFNKLNFGK